MMWFYFTCLFVSRRCLSYWAILSAHCQSHALVLFLWKL